VDDATKLTADGACFCGPLTVFFASQRTILALPPVTLTGSLGLTNPVECDFAAERRLRPVVMTTVATLAGLFPLALGIGAGAELQRPLAVAVIGGLVTSTLATLVILPPLAKLALERDGSASSRRA